MILIAAKIYSYKYYKNEDSLCSNIYAFLKKFVSFYSQTGNSEE